MTTAELSAGPMRARRHFYSWPSILSRAARGTLIWRDGRKIATMLAGNWISRREIFRKQGRPLAPGVAEPASAVGACS